MPSPAPAPDFVELTEDVSASPLWNADLAPVPIARRTWTTYNYAALWVSMAHCIPTYMLASGLISAGMNWWQALLTILLGNIIVLAPILLNSHPGTRYGIPFPVFARAAYGTVGSNLPALLRALVACGWFGIQAWIGGQAVQVLLRAFVPGWQTLLGGPNGSWLIAPAERMGNALQGALMVREGPRRAADGCETGDWNHVDVYLTKALDYRALVFTGSRFDGDAVRWMRERRSTFVAVGGHLPGAAHELRYPNDDDPLVALLTEVLVPELVAAHWWLQGLQKH